MKNFKIYYIILSFAILGCSTKQNNVSKVIDYSDSQDRRDKKLDSLRDNNSREEDILMFEMGYRKGLEASDNATSLKSLLRIHHYDSIEVLQTIKKLHP